MVESYLSVGGETERETIIERSRFICRVKRIEGEDDARAFIDGVRKVHSLATHNCYAYVASEDGNLCKFSDDGEPQGTAGMPMLEVLKNRKLCMTAAVVTRYFGGVKLGAGGLVRAYSGSVADCLNAAAVLSNELSAELILKLSYDTYSVFLKYVSDKKVKILNSEFGNDIAITCVLPRVLQKSFTEGLNDTLLGKLRYEKTKEYYFQYL
ncbi:MAG: YigZ family protein [Clostridia bacterium]|nr:YigZ family protein [Clostridia bacterium]